MFDVVKVKDMSAQLGTLEIASLQDAKLDPELRAELKIPGKRTEFALPPAKLLGLTDILKKVENSPVLFEGEAEKEGEGFAILSLTSLTPELFGKATLLQDVDGIAIHRRLDEVKGTKTCSGYKSKGKPVPDLTLELKETEVVIYDRRSSDQVAKKIFPPEDRCPMFAFGGKGDRTQSSSAPTAAIENWLRTNVKR